MRTTLLMVSFLLLAMAGRIHGEPANSPVTNHVLDLDGTNSWVELPANLFTNSVVTVEGWVKWREFAYMSRFFHFADASLHIAVMNRTTTNTLWLDQFTVPPFNGLR